MWRAVANAAGRAEPARLAGGDVVRGEPPGRGDDHEIVDDQGRTREAPAGVLDFCVGRRVARPHNRSRRGVERVQDSGRPECVDATVAERRRPARTGAATWLPEPGRIAVPPDRLARGHPITRDDLVVTALFLCIEKVPIDGERRPSWSDRPPPHFDRRRLGPVGVDAHVANDAVASGAAKAGPFDSRDSPIADGRQNRVGFWF